MDVEPSIDSSRTVVVESSGINEGCPAEAGQNVIVFLELLRKSANLTY